MYSPFFQLHFEIVFFKGLLNSVFQASWVAKDLNLCNKSLLSLESKENLRADRVASQDKERRPLGWNIWVIGMDKSLQKQFFYHFRVFWSLMRNFRLVHGIGCLRQWEMHKFVVPAAGKIPSTHCWLSRTSFRRLTERLHQSCSLPSRVDPAPSGAQCQPCMC